MRKARRKREDFGNQLPLNERLLALALFVGSLTYAYHSLAIDDLAIPARRSPPTHLHGWALFWGFLAFVNFALIALTFILDHYDRRFNARFYIGLRTAMLWSTIAFLITGIGVGLYQAAHE